MYRVRNMVDARFVVRITGYRHFLTRGYSRCNVNHVGNRPDLPEQPLYPKIILPHAPRGRRVPGNPSWLILESPLSIGYVSYRPVMKLPTRLNVLPITFVDGVYDLVILAFLFRLSDGSHSNLPMQTPPRIDEPVYIS